MPNPIGRALRSRHAGLDTVAWMRPDLAAPENVALTSSAFEHGTPIPARYRGRLTAVNLSPPLAWSAAPSGTVELVLIVEDPDAPGRTSPIHVLAAGIDPAWGGIAEGALARGAGPSGLIEGRGVLGRRGWAGPSPVPSHGPHRYVFQIFAVDAPLGLHAGFRLPEAVTAMAGHLLGRGRLDGTYEIP